MKILIIEDEVEIASSIDKYLCSMGYTCERVYTYTDALERIELHLYDCIIVDLTLPDGEGLDLVRHLKETEAEAGIIIVSARDGIDDKILGLDMGADDYLAKPFNLSELNARLKSVLRRRSFSGQKELRYNEIVIHPDERAVYINDQLIELTRKEYDLLIFLTVNKKRVLSKEMIVEHLWGDYMGVGADTFDALYTHIRKLRKKMQDCGGNDYIQTVYGVGYKFDLD